MGLLWTIRAGLAVLVAIVLLVICGAVRKKA